jgi:hypothetical protein
LQVLAVQQIGSRQLLVNVSAALPVSTDVAADTVQQDLSAGGQARQGPTVRSLCSWLWCVFAASLQLAGAMHLTGTTASRPVASATQPVMLMWQLLYNALC